MWREVLLEFTPGNIALPAPGGVLHRVRDWSLVLVLLPLILGESKSLSHMLLPHIPGCLTAQPFPAKSLVPVMGDINQALSNM